MADRDEVLPDETELTETDEMWFRQVHPKRWKDTIPSALSFRQSSNDQGKLSGCRSAKQTAKGAFDHHVGTLKKESEGTFGVSVGEIVNAGTRAIDDSAIVTTTPGHTYVDYRGLTKDEEKYIAAALALAASHRGRLHP